MMRKFPATNAEVDEWRIDGCDKKEAHVSCAYKWAKIQKEERGNDKWMMQTVIKAVLVGVGGVVVMAIVFEKRIVNFYMCTEDGFC